MSLFPKSFFVENRHRLQAVCEPGIPIVLTANGLLQRSNDTTFSFLQDSNFWYLTGIDEPDILLVIDDNKQYLIVPGRDDVRAAFDGAVDSAKLAKQSGITEVLPEAEGWKRLEKRLSGINKVATVTAPPAYIGRSGLYTNPARRRLSRQIKGIKQDIEMVDIRQTLARMRMIKQKPELKAIQRAVDVTVEAFQTLDAKSLKNFANEYEVEAQLASVFRKHGYGSAYEPIVASGDNACTLHYIRNDAKHSPDSLLLIDMGAEVEHYAADITRTYPLGGKPTARQQEVLAAVETVQAYAFSLLMPGITLKEYEAKVIERMADTLKALGLIKSADPKKARKFYPHSTSHFLGLDVHDVGDYEVPLAPGMVLTVEPGIYIAKEKIGVRIEDDVVITDTGIDILSSDLPTNGVK